MSTDLVPAGTAETESSNLPEHVQRGLYRVSVSEHAQHLKAALVDVAHGMSIKNAAALHDCDAEHLRTLSIRYELAHSKRVLRGHARVAALGVEEIERRMSEPGALEAMSDMSLNIYVGTSTDKLLKAEQLQNQREAQRMSHELALRKLDEPQADRSGYSSTLSGLLNKLQAGEKLTLTVERTRTNEIDVSPTETE